ncbi:prenyltransferase/squalene oxidase repeat-containing protein [Bacillus sp. FJAT-49736]|uniref:terpene cyclase/mutase family protein n=1 Tax=Bacillus sp. FJAT-49736 TaxID=2833582 RepID=UPI001BCA5A99|nr:prenyltransferase/squalene oxidase repeat-containing protein [Bacillus sp. FJAT-49736]MBS4172500.1 squalene--hopene cyclase [Bacillus sp. FJAT-49736]
MALKQNVLMEMNRYINRLIKDQLSDGSWDYAFDTGIKTDSYMIILLRMLELEDEELIKGLVARISSKQEQNGSWKLFHDEERGNLTTTVEAYYALLYSGYVAKDSANMLAAKKFIIENGGLEKTEMFTKILLALGGHVKWPSQFPIPVEAILLPAKFPINFFDISVFGRSNIAPILILSDVEFTLITKMSPDLSELLPERTAIELFREESPESRSLFDYIKQGVESLVGMKEEIHEKALQQLEDYMIKRIEEDGTFYSYFSATFLMIFALMARGRKKDDKSIWKAVDGLKSMICEINGHPHCQYTTANVWNTTLISYVLQEAGVRINSDTIRRANQYLLSKQHYKFGDWIIHNSSAKPGGWGFSNINSINPDVDDTTAALRAIRRQTFESKSFRASWELGVEWVLSMQNDDGGWPAFERNIDNPLLNILPGGEDLLLDASAADLTGRTLEFLGLHTNLNNNHSKIKNGVRWLLKNQESNGSWNSRWGICYIYGTWAAITGLRAVGVDAEHPAIQKAVEWLYTIQNNDGGWGESCNSDILKQYVPLNSSTLTHTAWATDALIAASENITPPIQKGINFLYNYADTKDWRTNYPMGQGAAGLFYIHYHSYNYIWPLLAYAHFIRKFY